MIRSHRDKDYELDLQQLEQYLLRMAGIIEEMIGGAIKAVIDRDTKLAERIIEFDCKVNQAEIDIDDHCISMLATRNPMAGDLRFITLSLKMTTDLERIGDLAVNISERAPRLVDSPDFRAYEDIEPLTRIVQSMVRDAIQAFIGADVHLAEEVIERDDDVDERYHRINRELLDLMHDDGKYVRAGMDVHSVVKFLERIADHSTNLAELVIYMVKGEDIRHLGKRFPVPTQPRG